MPKCPALRSGYVDLLLAPGTGEILAYSSSAFTYSPLVFSLFLVWIQSIKLTAKVHPSSELLKDIHKIIWYSWSFSSVYLYCICYTLISQFLLRGI